MPTDDKTPEMVDRAGRAVERAQIERRIDEGPIDPELIRRMTAALRRLPERHRAIFLAVRHDDATYAELASRYGIGIAAVEHELAQALVALAAAADG